MHGLNTGSQYCHSSFATVQSRLINMSDAESVTGRGTERSEQRTEQRTPDDSSAFAAFDLFKVYLDKKLSNFKRDISETSEINSEKIVKKLKSEQSYKFRFAGNEKQFQYNQEIQVELSKIERAAEKGDLRTVRDVCAEIGESIRKRNKCIKMADKSPAGWETVREYLSDELASDSEDEKRMRYA